MIRRTDCLEVTYISKWRKRPKNIWIETVKNDLETLNLNGKIVPDQTD